MSVVLPQTRELFDAGLGLYRSRLDKGYSLTDCMSMVVCQQLEPALRAGPPVPDGVRVGASWCSWANDGRLAMEYTLSSDQLTANVAIFDASLAFQRDLELPATSGARFNLFSWLPDGSGFVMSHQPPGASEPETNLVLLDGTTRVLPFEPHRVLAVFP